MSFLDRLYDSLRNKWALRGDPEIEVSGNPESGYFIEYGQEGNERFKEFQTFRELKQYFDRNLAQAFREHGQFHIGNNMDEIAHRRLEDGHISADNRDREPSNIRWGVNIPEMLKTAAPYADADTKFEILYPMNIRFVGEDESLDQVVSEMLDQQEAGLEKTNGEYGELLEDRIIDYMAGVDTMAVSKAHNKSQLDEPFWKYVAVIDDAKENEFTTYIESGFYDFLDTVRYDEGESD